MNTIQPQKDLGKFTCPHGNCNAIAKQNWVDYVGLGNLFKLIVRHFYLGYRSEISDFKQEAISGFLDRFNQEHNSYFLEDHLPRNMSIATCDACGQSTIWMDGKIVWPRNIPIDPPNTDLNEEIKGIYDEAANILQDSPRGAAALLRLALQKLMLQLGQEGKNINKDIGTLVSSGLSPKIQKALDLLRVVGNHAVHPGEINMEDNIETAEKMFKILNIIADEMITKPKEVDELYDDLVPEDTKEHINQRDNN